MAFSRRGSVGVRHDLTAVTERDGEFCTHLVAITIAHDVVEYHGDVISHVGRTKRRELITTIAVANKRSEIVHDRVGASRSVVRPTHPDHLAGTVGAVVRVYTSLDWCTDGLHRSEQLKAVGRVLEGADLGHQVAFRILETVDAQLEGLAVHCESLRQGTAGYRDDVARLHRIIGVRSLGVVQRDGVLYQLAIHHKLDEQTGRCDG